jgi:hypothetical protein
MQHYRPVRKPNASGSDIDGYGVATFYDLVGILIQSEVDFNLCNHFDWSTVK